MLWLEGGAGGPYPDNTLSPSLPFKPHNQHPGLTGGSRSCNTTAISGLWNGGGTGRGGRKENKGEGSDWEGGREGGGQVDCPLICSWLLQSRQVLWSLPSQHATTPNTKVSANGTPSLGERATWFLLLFCTPRGSNKQAFGLWALKGPSALCAGFSYRWIN